MRVRRPYIRHTIQNRVKIRIEGSTVSLFLLKKKKNVNLTHFFQPHILLSPSHAFIPFIPTHKNLFGFSDDTFLLSFFLSFNYLTILNYISSITIPLPTPLHPYFLSTYSKLHIFLFKFSSTLFWVYAKLCFSWLPPVPLKCFTTPPTLAAKKFKPPLLKLSSLGLFMPLLCKELPLLTFVSLLRLLLFLIRLLNSLLKITLFSHL